MPLIKSWGFVKAVNNSYLNKSKLKSSPGSSGGGIYIKIDGKYYVTGVVSTNPAGAYINTTRKNAIKRWIKGNNVTSTSDAASPTSKWVNSLAPGALVANGEQQLAGSNFTLNKNHKRANALGVALA